jgi:anti-sigma regulatory factor (Ser/Thr protein kinase)
MFGRASGSGALNAHSGGGVAPEDRAAPVGGDAAFHHEALLYANEQEFLGQTLAFIREGADQRDAMLVALSQSKIELLREELGSVSDEVRFADLSEIGRNPATIIPIWSEFVAASSDAGRACRGIAEPVSPGRAGAALAECRNHEALLNMAFEDGIGWRLLCLYDTEMLTAETVADAWATHPFVAERGASRRSAEHEGEAGQRNGLTDPLSPPPVSSRELPFGSRSMGRLRGVVDEFAQESGLEPTRASDLVIAVNELVGNTIRHGGGRGVLRMWREEGSVLCEVGDHGSITDPLVGRRKPTTEQVGGRGLWIANHLCDLVQLRSEPGQTTVRLHMTLPAD